MHVPFVVEDNHVENALKTENTDSRLRLLLVAKAIPRKNIILVIRTLNELLKRDIRVSLSLVTEVTTKDHHLHLQEILNCVSALGVSRHINILQNVKYSEMANVYRQSDIFILPSFNEPASVSVIEAMAYGCVAISTVQNGTATYINHGENGFIFDPNDMAELVQII